LIAKLLDLLDLDQVLDPIDHAGYFIAKRSHRLSPDFVQAKAPQGLTLCVRATYS
jgi:hypothetical protein